MSDLITVMDYSGPRRLASLAAGKRARELGARVPAPLRHYYAAGLSIRLPDSDLIIHKFRPATDCLPGAESLETKA